MTSAGERSAAPVRGAHARLLTWSAASRRALREQLATHGEGMRRDPRPHDHRLALVMTGDTDVRALLALATERLSRPGVRRLRLPSGVYYAEPNTQALPHTAFLFPGQGSLHLGMLGELRVCWPPLEQALHKLDAAVDNLMEGPLSRLMAGPGAATDAERQRRLVDLAGGAQLGFVIELALFHLLGRLGIGCDAMLGHSNGEHAALVASGLFRLPGSEAVYEVSRRLMRVAQELPPPADAERAIAVSNGDREQIAALLEEHRGQLFLAMDNCPHQSVLAGREPAVAVAASQLADAGAVVLRLPFERAFHTPLFTAWQERLHAVYRETAVGAARIALYACSTTEPYPTDPEGVRRQAAHQWSTCVHFGATIERLYADGVRCFVEVGPGRTLSGFVGDVLRDRPHLAVSTCSRRRGDLVQLHHLAAERWVQGYGVDLAALRDLAAGRLDRAAAGAPRVRHAPQRQILEQHLALMDDFLAGQERSFDRLGTALASAAKPRAGAPRSELHLTLAADPYLQDHSLGRQVSPRDPDLSPLPVVAFTHSLELIARAAVDTLGSGVVTAITAVRAYRWLALDRGALRIAIDTKRLEPATADARPVVAIKLFELADGQRQLAFEGQVEVADGDRASPAGEDTGAFLGAFPGSLPRPETAHSVEAFYRDFAFHGPLFQSLIEVTGLAGDALTARLRVTGLCREMRSATGKIPLLDPALLDGVAQLVGFWLLASGRRDFGIFPFQLAALRLDHSLPAEGSEVSCHGRVHWDARGATVADFALHLPGGASLCRVEGLEQRYLELPPTVTRRLVAIGEPPLLSVAVEAEAGVVARQLALAPDWLAGSWGVWSRAIAHLVLDAGELAAWYASPGARDIAWLCSAVAAKEAVCAWVLEHRGLRLAAAEVIIDGPIHGRVSARGSRLEQSGTVPSIRVEAMAGGITAIVDDAPFPAASDPEPSAATFERVKV